MAEIIGVVTTIVTTIMKTIHDSAKKVEEEVKAPFIRVYVADKSTQTRLSLMDRLFNKRKKYKR